MCCTGAQSASWTEKELATATAISQMVGLRVWFVGTHSANIVSEWGLRNYCRSIEWSALLQDDRIWEEIDLTGLPDWVPGTSQEKEDVHTPQSPQSVHLNNIMAIIS